MHTEALGSNWRSADDLVLGAENLLSPPSAIALGPPVYMNKMQIFYGRERT